MSRLYCWGSSTSDAGLLNDFKHFYVILCKSFKLYIKLITNILGIIVFNIDFNTCDHYLSRGVCTFLASFSLWRDSDFFAFFFVFLLFHLLLSLVLLLVLIEELLRRGLLVLLSLLLFRLFFSTYAGDLLRRWTTELVLRREDVDAWLHIRK